MTRSKLGLLGLCAMVLGVMAISAGAAQGAAFAWVVLNASETIATELKALVVGEKDSAHLTLLTHLLGIAPSITCTNFELVGVNLETGGKLTTGGKVKFTGCEAYLSGTLTTALGCNVQSKGQPVGTIETNSLKGELILHILEAGKTEVLMKLDPEVAGGPFATILTEECILPESNPVKGVLYLKDGENRATTHVTKHLIEQGLLTSLFVGTDNKEHLETSLDGSAWVKLNGAHKALEWAGAFALQAPPDGTWLVLNAAGTTATELKAVVVGEKDSTHLTLLTHHLGQTLALTCTSFESIGVNLETGGKLTEGGKVKFTGCELYEKAALVAALGCNVHSLSQPAGTLLTNELKGQLVLHDLAAGGTERLVRIEPQKEGGTLMNFLTEECVLFESMSVRGTVFIKDSEGKAEGHLVKHLIEQGSPTSLSIFAHSAEHLDTSIIGSAWVTLGGAHTGLKWSAMDA
jgi:hypothetical protein